MDPPESLTVRLTTASSPISGYRLIDKSILTDEFLLVSCPGCHGIQCLKLCDNNEKKKERFGKTFTTQLHYLLILPHIFHLERD